MDKYIEADKLITALEKRMEETKSMKPAFDQFWAGQISAFNGAVDIAKSLQQEPRFPQYNNIVEKVFGAGNIEGFEYREAEMLVALAKEELLKSLQQEQPEVDLGKFTEKIKTFQERYKYPEIVSIKGAMAFMARMFYQYPNVARRWYDGLSKATMDDARKEESK